MSLIRLFGQFGCHPKTLRLQFRGERHGCELNEVRCQAQALEITLLVALRIEHAHLLEGVSRRMPALVLSVVHTTEQDPPIRNDAGEGSRIKAPG
jgi:hypothetical protein